MTTKLNKQNPVVLILVVVAIIFIFSKNPFDTQSIVDSSNVEFEIEQIGGGAAGYSTTGGDDYTASSSLFSLFSMALYSNPGDSKGSCGGRIALDPTYNNDVYDADAVRKCNAYESNYDCRIIDKCIINDKLQLEGYYFCGSYDDPKYYQDVCKYAYPNGYIEPKCEDKTTKLSYPKNTPWANMCYSNDYYNDCYDECGFMNAGPEICSFYDKNQKFGKALSIPFNIRAEKAIWYISDLKDQWKIPSSKGNFPGGNEFNMDSGANHNITISIDELNNYDVNNDGQLYLYQFAWDIEEGNKDGCYAQAAAGFYRMIFTDNVVECLNDDHCSDDQVCYNEKCMTAQCIIDTDCGFGQYCDNFNCIDSCNNDDTRCSNKGGYVCNKVDSIYKCIPGCRYVSNDKQSNCPVGAVCTNEGSIGQCIIGSCRDNSDCNSNQVCSFENNQLTCTDKECDSSSDCPLGNVCSKNKCIESDDCQNDDTRCASNEVCKSTSSGYKCFVGCRSSITDKQSNCAADEVCKITTPGQIYGECVTGNCRELFEQNDCTSKQICQSTLSGYKCTNVECTKNSQCGEFDYCDPTTLTCEPMYAGRTQALKDLHTLILNPNQETEFTVSIGNIDKLTAGVDQVITFNVRGKMYDPNNVLAYSDEAYVVSPVKLTFKK